MSTTPVVGDAVMVDEGHTAAAEACPRRVPFPVAGVDVFDQAVPEPLARDLHQTLHLYGWTYGWLSNHLLDGSYGHWNRTFAGGPREHRDNVESEIRAPAICAAWKAVESLLPGTPTLIRCYSNAHTYGVEGYIHQDSPFASDLTAILYLNQEWDANDAGELIFLDSAAGEITGAVLPKWNRLVVFPGPIQHAARSLSRRSKHARICLVFKTKNDPTPSPDAHAAEPSSQ